MSAWSKGVYTVQGYRLLSKLTQGTSLKITRAVIGTGYVDPDKLAQQTKVTGEKQELTFQTATYPEAGSCKLPVFISNKGVTSGYTGRMIGVYALDPDIGEILYFASQSVDGTENCTSRNWSSFKFTGPSVRSTRPDALQSSMDADTDTSSPSIGNARIS